MKHYQYNHLAYLLGALMLLIALRVFAANRQQQSLAQQVEQYFCEAESTKKENLTNSPAQPHKKDKPALRQRKVPSEPIATTPKSTKKRHYPKRKASPTKNEFRAQLPQQSQSLNCNTATVAEWKQLRGIGDVLSERIVKFRNRLGGFHSISQISEVYGLSPETYDAIATQLTCSGAVSQLNISKAEFKTLLRHPYLDYEEVKGLKNYVQRTGPITDVNTLMKATGKSEVDAKKLFPYLLLVQPKS